MFDYRLTFADRSYECKLAVFGRSDTNGQAPCLPVRVKYGAGGLAHEVSDGVSVFGDGLDVRPGASYQASWDCVLLDCSNAQVAAHLNGVIAEGLLRLPRFNSEEEPLYYWRYQFGLLSIRAGQDGARYRWLGETPMDGGRLKLTGARTLLAAHPPNADPLFWGRVRVMVIEAMDEAGLFKKVSTAG